MSSSPDPEQLRLAAADFDAYLPDRASSNAFSGPRSELRARMLAWSRGVVARLAELGMSVEVTASDDRPTLRNGRRVDWQRVLFSRDALSRARIEQLLGARRSFEDELADQASHQKHPFLALRVDAKGVEVSVEVFRDAWVDVKNLHARLADPGGTLELTSALEALPEQFTIGLGGDDANRASASRATSDSIRALLDRAEQEGRPVWLGWTIPRDVAITHTELLDDQLEDAIVALAPIVKLIAWAPDNDLFDLRTLAEATKEGERAREEGEAERDRIWQAKRDRIEADARPSRTSERPRLDDAPTESQEPSEPVMPVEAREPPTARAPRPLGMPRILRRAPLATEVDRSAPIEKGTRVHVLGGPFRGKVGVVQELDGKGAARVMLGLLATRVDVKDLIAAAEGKERPALASSHRRPGGVRS